MAEYSFCTLSLCKIFQLETKPTAMGFGGEKKYSSGICIMPGSWQLHKNYSDKWSFKKLILLRPLIAALCAVTCRSFFCVWSSDWTFVS